MFYKFVFYYIQDKLLILNVLIQIMNYSLYNMCQFKISWSYSKYTNKISSDIMQHWTLELRVNNYAVNDLIL